MMSEKKATLRLFGLNCAVCASKVEKALGSLPGVEEASVNFAALIAVVRYDPEETSLSEMINAVTALGYGAEADNEESDQASAVISIGGMSCVMCASRIEKALSETEGVSDASVNFAASQALVLFDPEKVKAKDLQQVVKDAGYNVISMELKGADAQLPQVEPGKDVSASSMELRGLRHRLITGVILAVPVFILSMPGLFPFIETVPWKIRAVTLLMFTAPVQFYVGWPFIKNTWVAARHFSADMNTLVAAGTLSAFLYSLFVTLFPNILKDAGLSLHLYYDSAAMIIVFVLLGRWLERRARDQAAGAIKKLLTLTPSTAIVIRNGMEKKVPVSSITVGETVKIAPSNAIPVDGVIIDGSSEVDESMLTGESLPVKKAPGMKVIAGTLNQWGAFTMRAEKVGAETVLAGIVRIVQEAQGSKASIQRLADRVASRFVPCVIVVASVAGAVWYFAGPEPYITNSMVTFVTVMVIACPCAMGLATPAAIMAGTGRGAERGILIKDAAAVEKAAGISEVVFDKTGTLTCGRPEVTDIVATSAWDENVILRLAAALESLSEHPLAAAIVKRAQEESPAPLHQIVSFKAVPGMGVSGVAPEGFIENEDQCEVAAGTWAFMEKSGINTADAQEVADELAAEGKTVIWVAVNREAAGIIALADSVRKDAPDAVRALRKMGIMVRMLTGDNRSTAEATAKRLGIDAFEAEVLPSEKALFIKRLQKKGKSVAMVGDGVNDAPALAQADVGVAMGSGTDIAMDAADIGIMREELMAVPEAVDLLRSTLKIIRQNLFWAFAYNIIAIPVAAGVLYPVWGIRLSPVFASAAMAMSSVTVVTNALRLRFAGNMEQRKA